VLPDDAPFASVLNGLGDGFVPLVLPALGLLWLAGRKPAMIHV
jgi:hypothetical protein